MPVIVASPAVEDAIGSDGQNVRVAGYNLGIGKAGIHAVGQGDSDRGLLHAGIGRFLSQLPVLVASPCIGVSVAGDSYGETVGARGLVASGADLVEADASVDCRRGDGHVLAAEHVAFFGVQGPVVVHLGPVGGQGDVAGDGLTEVVGDLGVVASVFDEPSVE